VQNWTLYLQIVVQVKILMLLNALNSNSCSSCIPVDNMESVFVFLLSIKAIDSIHQVGVYCLALVPANTLPKAPLGGIHISETKQRFLEGALHPCNVLMCPHTCVTNLPKPRQKQPGGWSGECVPFVLRVRLWRYAWSVVRRRCDSSRLRVLGGFKLRTLAKLAVCRSSPELREGIAVCLESH